MNLPRENVKKACVHRPFRSDQGFGLSVIVPLVPAIARLVAVGRVLVPPWERFSLIFFQHPEI